MNPFKLLFEAHRCFPDLFETSALILIPALMEGLRRTSQQDHTAQELLSRADTDDALYFFCYILQKLEIL